MILLDSLYINNSGGKILLDLLVKELSESTMDVFYLLDKRCQGAYPFLPENKVLYLKASLKNRHLFYKKNKDKFSKVFCFANLPPTIKIQAPVYTYFHNLLLLQQPSDYPFKGRSLFKLKGALIKLFKKNSDYYIVQAAHVKNILRDFLTINESQILIIPFYREVNIDIKFQEKENGFIYISNGNPHKNHLSLLKAWEILKEKKGINIPLHLTITEEYPALIELIDNYRNKGLNITNHSFVDVKDLYSKYKYTVYPSLTESFGLGLIESIDTQTEVIAADLPYVHTIIKPLKTFDPFSSASIAEAIANVVASPPEIFVSEKKVKNQIKEIVSLLNT
ncbi:MAG: glycosyltransferase [Cytophagaceae bacterium]|nr:glycosyltransferase [Cytophagaceae bacterium]